MQTNQTIENQVLIQDGINYPTSWCSTNLMELNVKKCKYMCSTRSSPTNGFYTMNSAVLELVKSFNDLRIIFDCKLDYRNHNRAKEFSDPYVAKQLFSTLVCPILEFLCNIGPSIHCSL